MDHHCSNNYGNLGPDLVWQVTTTPSVYAKVLSVMFDLIGLTLEPSSMSYGTGDGYVEELTFSAKRLYRREIVLFAILGIILGPLSVVAQGTSAFLSLLFALSSLLAFMIVILFFILARRWIRPLTFRQDIVRFGAWETSVSKLSGIECRPERRWVILTLKQGFVPRIQLLELSEKNCGNSEFDEIKSWTLSHGLLFHRF